MENIKEKILSYSSIIGATIGALVSIVSFTYATYTANKFNSDLLTGILAAIVGLIFAYILYYVVNKNTTSVETKKEVGLLRESIKELVRKKQQKTIFLSYNHRNKDYAQKLIQELKKASLNVWNYEENIKVGENWNDSIKSALTESDYFLFLISKEASNSKYLFTEFELAMKSNKKILPVLIDDSNPPDYISNIRYANLNDNYYEGIEELLKSLKIDIEGNSEIKLAGQ